jgi:hypothetical protein
MMTYRSVDLAGANGSGAQRAALMQHVQFIPFKFHPGTVNES